MAKMRHFTHWDLSNPASLVPDDQNDGDDVEISQNISAPTESCGLISENHCIWPALCWPVWDWDFPHHWPPIFPYEDKMLFTFHAKWLWFCELLRSQHVPGSHVNGVGIKTKQSKQAFDNKWVYWKWVVSAEGSACFLLVYWLWYFGQVFKLWFASVVPAIKWEITVARVS